MDDIGNLCDFCDFYASHSAWISSSQVLDSVAIVQMSGLIIGRPSVLVSGLVLMRLALIEFPCQNCSFGGGQLFKQLGVGLITVDTLFFAIVLLNDQYLKVLVLLLTNLNYYLQIWSLNNKKICKEPSLRLSI